MIVRVAILELDYGIGPFKVLRCRGYLSHVEYYGRYVGGDGRAGVVGGVVHICQVGRGVAVGGFIKEDAVDGDVGGRVTGPVGVDADVVGELGVRGAAIACVYVAKRLDVRVAVQSSDISDII